MPDARITDAQEAHDLPEVGDPLAPDGDSLQPDGTTAASTTCSYESTLRGPNAAPASPSIQHVYFLPWDATAAESMDRPRSCSDGSVKASAVANAARNITVWQAARAADLNYRNIKQTYNHNYTGGTYTTRAVRRFRSEHSTAWHNQRDLNTRLQEMVIELSRDGWNTADTKYIAMQHAAAEEYLCGVRTCYGTGIAILGGDYGFTVRYYAPTVNTSYAAVRYGCDTSGDVYLGHETTHLLGADHVADTKYDLMFRSYNGERSLRTTVPGPLYWDYNRNDYHNTVRNSPYVISGGLAGSVTTC